MQICIDCQEVDGIRVGISVTPQNLKERGKKEIYLGLVCSTENFLTFDHRLSLRAVLTLNEMKGKEQAWQSDPKGRCEGTYPFLSSSPLEGVVAPGNKVGGVNRPVAISCPVMRLLPPNACLPREIQSISGTLVLEITS
jgi:hypothetical protein